MLRIFNGTLIALGLLVIGVGVKEAGADDTRVFSAKLSELRCLVENAPAYVSVSYDPIVVDPVSCPSVPFDGIDLAALIQNSAEKRAALIIFKEDYACLLADFEKEIAARLGKDEETVVEIEIVEDGDCG